MNADLISLRRRGLLKVMAFDKVMCAEAEQLHNIRPDVDRPAMVVMNPPFSNADYHSGTKDVAIGTQ